ncbi:MAG TPA: TetR/AcrR family transcriptional regulator [Bacteroidales bacterium]|jgi:AcrR family transcriptional regulator|nr:TetR/AcrR family transcriptional regulator [Bacteroidales bacterium]OQB57748.1 MAG: regulatory protein [Bacteroidetes bacterium ADurb.Bin145]HOU02306.1 TetR/AcrR family transcriptional regulator [Bacteroidales bacterium]HQG62854.1 TetR/AcrR family transcriptional regulator [Bacteroidales bacterium]HQK68311.1 TetR/AcrR family transcriptional regulator [Bacteroidales bacterium]
MKVNIENKKYKSLLETGKKLFWKHGFRRVTIDEICHEAGVSKMTFYKWFDNKTGFAKTIFSNEVQRAIIEFRKIMEKEMPPAERLKTIITMKMEGTNDISREFLMDFYSSDDTSLKSFVDDLTSKSWNEIISSFRMAQEKGWFRKDFKPEFILYLTQHLIPMYTDENLLKLYDTPQDLIMEFTNFFTYGISPHE